MEKSILNQRPIEQSNIRLHNEGSLSSKISSRHEDIQQMKEKLNSLEQSIPDLCMRYDRSGHMAEKYHEKLQMQLTSINQELGTMLAVVAEDLETHNKEDESLHTKLEVVNKKIIQLKTDIIDNKKNTKDRAEESSAALLALNKLEGEAAGIPNKIATNTRAIEALKEQKLGILKIFGYCLLCLTVVGIIAVVKLEQKRSEHNDKVAIDKGKLGETNRQLQTRQDKIAHELLPLAKKTLEMHIEIHKSAEQYGSELNEEMMSRKKFAEELLSSLDKLKKSNLSDQFNSLTILESALPKEIETLDILSDDLENIITQQEHMPEDITAKLLSLKSVITEVKNTNEIHTNIAHTLKQQEIEAEKLQEAILMAESELENLEDDDQMNRSLFNSLEDETISKAKSEFFPERIYEPSSEIRSNIPVEKLVRPIVNLEDMVPPVGQLNEPSNLPIITVDVLANQLIEIAKSGEPGSIEQLKSLLKFFSSESVEKFSIQEIVEQAVVKSDDEGLALLFSQLQDKPTEGEIRATLIEYYNVSNLDETIQFELLSFIGELDQEKESRIMNMVNPEINSQPKELKTKEEYAEEFISKINSDETITSENFLDKYNVFMETITLLAIEKENFSISEYIMGTIFNKVEKITNPEIKAFIQLLTKYQYLGDEQFIYMGKKVDMQELEKQRIQAENMAEIGVGIKNLGVEQERHNNADVIAQIVQEHILSINEGVGLIPVKRYPNDTESINQIVAQSATILAEAIEQNSSTGRTFKEDMLVRIISYQAFDNRNQKIQQALQYIDQNDFASLATLYMATNPLLPREMFEYLAIKMGVVHERQFISLKDNHYSSIFGTVEDTPNTGNRCWAYSLREMKKIQETIAKNEELKTLRHLLEQGLALDKYKEWATKDPKSMLSIMAADMNK